MPALLSNEVVIAIRQQREESRALHRLRQLALVARLGSGDAAGDDLAGLGHVLLEGSEILVIDVLHAFGGEAAILAAAEKLGHVGGSSLLSGRAAHHAASLRSFRSLRSSSSSSSRRRDGLSSLSLVFRIRDCSVSAQCHCMIRCRSTASLNRNPDFSSAMAFGPHSMFISA